MNRLKCSHCGLVNAAWDKACRRCGTETGRGGVSRNLNRGPREAAKSSSWLYTLLFLAIICGAAYYLFSGVEKSYEDIRASENNRISKQSKQQTDGSLSRTEFEKKQTGSYKTALQNSPSISASDKRLAETQKLMQPASNATQK